MINPLVLFLGTGGFIASFVIHILIWRIIKPKKHLLWLGVIFIILPIMVYVILFFLNSLSPDYKTRFITSYANMGFIIILHLALSGAYIMSYPLIQADCPSLKIILAVSDSMPGGKNKEAINNIFSRNALLSDRLEDLVNDGLISLKHGECILSFKGRLLVAFFSLYRRLLNLPLGEG